VVTTRNGAIAVIDADRAPGPSAMVAAMDTAIELANDFSIGWCSARNITHAGAVGYFALRAAEAGCVGIVMTASGPLMAYHGSRAAGLSTNPLSIAVPASGRPLLLDMSTSTVALGKIMHARDTGTAIPDSWALDETGAATTDAKRAVTLTPMAGPKGSGLSLMIEILSSVLISNPAISTALAGGNSAMNGAALAIRIDRFGTPETFARLVTELVTELKHLPPAPGSDQILMPGERGFRLAQDRMASGIPVAQGTVNRLAETAANFGLRLPDPQDA
jgi:ureidoglycolate dehydrogenase (NAD+)